MRRGKQRFVFETRPAHYQVIRDIDYLTPPSTEKADLYLPREVAGKRPAIVVIHGGGWVEGDKGNLRELSICADLANHGYVVLAINYTLVRAGDLATLWPRNLHDCKTAVRWLRKNAAEYQIDPDHLGVLGESAGGHLAALVALTGLQHGLDPTGPYGEFSCQVQAAVDMYGPADFRQRDKPLAMLGKWPTEAPELYAQASPAAYGHKSDPPLLIIHGEADATVPVLESQNFATALSRAGAPHELVLVPNGSHAFDLRPKEKDLRSLVFGFFDKCLKRVFLVGMAWASCTIASKADDASKLADLGTYFDNPKGELIVQLTGDRGYAVWQNGRLLPITDCAMANEAFLKPGESLVVGGPEGFSRYRLDRLSHGQAAFTIWRYSPDSRESHHFRPGKTLSIETANVDLPLMIFDDSQPNLVQLRRGPAQRSK